VVGRQKQAHVGAQGLQGDRQAAGDIAQPAGFDQRMGFACDEKYIGQVLSGPITVISLTPASAVPTYFPLTCMVWMPSDHNRMSLKKVAINSWNGTSVFEFAALW